MANVVARELTGRGDNVGKENVELSSSLSDRDDAVDKDSGSDSALGRGSQVMGGACAEEASLGAEMGLKPKLSGEVP